MTLALTKDGRAVDVPLDAARAAAEVLLEIERDKESTEDQRTFGVMAAYAWSDAAVEATFLINPGEWRHREMLDRRIEDLRQHVAIEALKTGAALVGPVRTELFPLASYDETGATTANLRATRPPLDRRFSLPDHVQMVRVVVSSPTRPLVKEP